MFSSNYLLSYFNDQLKLIEIGTDAFLIRTAVANLDFFTNQATFITNPDNFCYHKSRQGLLQIRATFVQIGAQQVFATQDKIV